MPAVSATGTSTPRRLSPSRALRHAVTALVAATALTCAPHAAAQPSTDPVALVDSLLAADRVLRSPSAPPAQLQDAARRQQLAYRTLGRHPEWDSVARQRVSEQLRGVYDRNIDARRQLVALAATEPKATLPPWRIVAPAPAGELLGYYRQAQAATGVGWNYLAAINLVETGFGRIVGPSSANAHGPMQFLPSTFAQYGNGGDIYSPRDAIMAAGRYLAASGFAEDPGRAVFAYNHSDHYVQAITDYATVLAADPAAFAGYYRWDVYYHTTSGDVLLPIGYAASAPIPVEQYLAAHPR